MDLKTILRALMHQHQWTATELARRSQVAQPIILRLLSSDIQDPTLSTLKKLSGAFGITLSQFVGEEPLPQ